MPPSPANCNRLRSESFDVFIPLRSKRNLFTKKPSEDNPSSIEYWLPCYCDTDEEELSFTKIVSNSLQKRNNGVFNYNKILSYYNKLKGFMSQNRK